MKRGRIVVRPGPQTHRRIRAAAKHFRLPIAYYVLQAALEQAHMDAMDAAGGNWRRSPW